MEYGTVTGMAAGMVRAPRQVAAAVEGLEADQVAGKVVGYELAATICFGGLVCALPAAVVVVLVQMGARQRPLFLVLCARRLNMVQDQDRVQVQAA